MRHPFDGINGPNAGKPTRRSALGRMLFSAFGLLGGAGLARTQEKFTDINLRCGSTGSAPHERRTGRLVTAGLAAAATGVAQWGGALGRFSSRIAALQGHAPVAAAAALTVAAVADPLRLPDPKVARPPVNTVKFDG